MRTALALYRSAKSGQWEPVWDASPAGGGAESAGAPVSTPDFGGAAGGATGSPRSPTKEEYNY